MLLSLVQRQFAFPQFLKATLLAAAALIIKTADAEHRARTRPVDRSYTVYRCMRRSISRVACATSIYYTRDLLFYCHRSAIYTYIYIRHMTPLFCVYILYIDRCLWAAITFESWQMNSVSTWNLYDTTSLRHNYNDGHFTERRKCTSFETSEISSTCYTPWMSRNAWLGSTSLKTHLSLATIFTFCLLRNLLDKLLLCTRKC